MNEKIETIIRELETEKHTVLEQDSWLAYGSYIKQIADPWWEEDVEDLVDDEIYWWGDEVIPLYKLNVWETEDIHSDTFKKELEAFLKGSQYIDED